MHEDRWGGQLPAHWSEQLANRRTMPDGERMVPVIRGRIVYVGGLRPSEFTFAGETVEGVRVVDHVEIDGVRYLPAPQRDWDDCEVLD